MKKCCDTCIRMIGWVNMTPGLEFQGHADCGGNDTVSKLFTECLETVIFSMKSRQSWMEVSLSRCKKNENDDACTARQPVQWPGKIRSGWNFLKPDTVGSANERNFWIFLIFWIFWICDVNYVNDAGPMLMMMTPMVIMMMAIIRPMIASLAAPERWKPPITAWILKMANFDIK